MFNKVMTQEDKQLLLKDLCARLTYGVKLFYKYKTWDSEKIATSIRLADGKIALSSKFNKEGDWFPIEEAGEILIKPYLRPMSSMTEEEDKEYTNIDNRSYSCPINYAHIPASDRIDWLNAHHFDYRGLIEKGLAIEVTKENNPYKN
jgi:hypothetical protein